MKQLGQDDVNLVVAIGPMKGIERLGAIIQTAERQCIGREKV